MGVDNHLCDIFVCDNVYETLPPSLSLMGDCGLKPSKLRCTSGIARRMSWDPPPPHPIASQKMLQPVDPKIPMR